MVARAHLFIDGRVQGVAYRYFTQHLALSLGLAGWVRNLPDDRVEAVFEGPGSLIEEAIRRCNDGPPSAIVTNITEDWSEKPEGLADFTIRR